MDTEGLNVELSTINRLYLELSQITTAKTSRDLELDYQRIISQRRGKLIQDIYNCDEAELLPSDLKIRMNDEIMCYNMKDSEGGRFEYTLYGHGRPEK